MQFIVFFREFFLIDIERRIGCIYICIIINVVMNVIVVLKFIVCFYVFEFVVIIYGGGVIVG